MKRLLLLLLLIPSLCYAVPPSRTYTYSSGSLIQPNEVTTNEDSIYTYLQAGVDTIKDGAVGNTKLDTNAVTTDKILAGTILNADISSSAAIDYSKLSLSSSILSTDIKNDEIVNADINSSAAIVDTKLAQISTASKVKGSALTTLSGIPSGAGQIPVANLGTGTGSSSNFLRGDGAWNLPTKAQLGIDSGTISVDTGNPTAVSFNFTYSVAPVISLTVEWTGGTTWTATPTITAKSTTGFTIRHDGGSTCTVHWVAFGTPA